jgi:hypothetical protein
MPRTPFGITVRTLLRLVLLDFLDRLRTVATSGSYSSVGVRTARLAPTLIAQCHSLKISKTVVCDTEHVMRSHLRKLGVLTRP